MVSDSFLVEATNFLKAWLPWITAGGLLWRGYHKLRQGVDAWAGSLLDNHLHHLQLSLSNMERLLQKLVEKE